MSETLSRHEELEAKGWKNLKGDERKELQALRANSIEPDEAPVESPVETPPVKAKPSKEVDLVEETRLILSKKPQVNFIIPLGDNESPDAFDTVQINGYKLTIKKGVMVTIPQPCAELLATKYRVNMEAGRAIRTDRNNNVSSALN